MDHYLESRMLHFYGGRAENYLNDWARRGSHLDDISKFTVEVTHLEGIPWGHIVLKQDDPVAETPTECHNHNARDETASPEKVDGRRRKKAADKSGDPFA